jgi:hypothetical protein
MPLLADYEGLNAAFGLIFGLIVMAPAFLLGVGGAVAGSMTPPRRNLAVWLGALGLLLGIAATGLALSGFWEDRHDLDAHGNHFYPPPYLYLAVVATLGASAYAMFQGMKRRTSPVQTDTTA